MVCLLSCSRVQELGSPSFPRTWFLNPSINDNEIEKVRLYGATVPKPFSSDTVSSTTDVNSCPADPLQPHQLPKKDDQPNPSPKVSSRSDTTTNVSVESVEDEREEAVMISSLVDSMDSLVGKDEYQVMKLRNKKEVEKTYPW